MPIAFGNTSLRRVEARLHRLRLEVEDFARHVAYHLMRIGKLEHRKHSSGWPSEPACPRRRRSRPWASSLMAWRSVSQTLARALRQRAEMASPSGSC